jgi:hypothetical protein
LESVKGGLVIDAEVVRLLIRDFQDETGNSVTCANSPLETYRDALPDLCKYLADRLSAIAQAAVQPEHAEMLAADLNAGRLTFEELRRMRS